MIPTVLLLAAVSAPPADPRLFELRVYTADAGKLDALVARFRDDALPVLSKCGIPLLAAWLPTPNPDNQFVALVAHPDRAARDAAFKRFAADPDWKRAVTKSEAGGKLVTKVDEYFLTCTDYSPTVEVAAAAPPRAFELRMYQSTSGNPEAINARFRDHTVKLFGKHGMTNLWYWNLAPGNKETKYDLVYMLAHPSAAARNKAFDDFRKDPAWDTARKASEAKAGGSLTTKDGVKSVLLTPTEFSPLK